MSFSLDNIRSWNIGALAEASSDVTSRARIAEEVRRILSDGAEALDEGWDGRAADAVLSAADAEKSNVMKLADGLDDLADALERAKAALGPAVQAVHDRVAAASSDGLEVDGTALRPLPARTDISQATIDGYAEAISDAVDTVRSLDEHYGREIDGIAGRLHQAIPPEVNRSPIPAPDDPWSGRSVGVMTGGMQAAFPRYANDLDPSTRGAHAASALTDDLARFSSTGFRAMGKAAGPLGIGLTTYGGVRDYAEGRVSADEALIETGGALGGGAVGGALAGAAAGSVFGPVGTFIGAGVGAAVGAELGKNAGDCFHKRFFDE